MRFQKEKKTMKNAIIGMTMTMALAGVSLFAQTSPAPATSSSTTKTTASKKAGVKKHTKSAAKSTAKTASATTK
jgi:hypothetical protein